MNPIASHYLRIDGRSLGLFRVLFGGALIADWCARLRDVQAFYSNEGVLPNHNHLFNLKNEGKMVWSALHSTSTPGEATFALFVILFFYVSFTLGWRTRAFQALSLVSLVSLAGRNTLASGPGDWLGIGLLAVTLWLPLGTRFSIDALFRGAREHRADTAAELQARSGIPTEEETIALRSPGWSPGSIAALGVLVQMVLLFLSLALQQRGAAWADGSALGRAFSSFAVATPLGASIGAGGLSVALTHLVRGLQWVVPALLLVPVARGPVRAVAALGIALHGLVYGLFLNLGLFGWAIASMAALALSRESWDAVATRHVPARVRTVIYDADCGICFWLCKLLARLDAGRHLVFQPNQGQDEERGFADLEKLLAWDEKKGALTTRDMPASVNAKLVEETVVAVDPDGNVTTRAEAVRDVLRALPGLSWLGVIVGLPVFSSIAGIAYDAFAARRTTVSTELGLSACGTGPAPAAKGGASARAASPATLLLRRISGAGRELGAALAVGAIVAQTAAVNPLGFSAGPLEPLTRLAWWARVEARWGEVLAPEPPTTQGWMVTDTIVRDERVLDVLTGAAPTGSTAAPFRLGAQWARYLDTIQREEFRPYQSAFKAYLGKRGPRWAGEEPSDKVVGIEAFWLTGPVGGGEEPKARRLFRSGRGGSGAFRTDGGTSSSFDEPKRDPSSVTRRLQAPEALDEAPPAPETPAEAKDQEPRE